jgi:hypothetical protein
MAIWLRGLERWYLVLGGVAVGRGFEPQSDLELSFAKISWCREFIHPVCRFFREFFFYRFYTIMAKLLEINPINHIYLER